MADRLKQNILKYPCNVSNLLCVRVSTIRSCRLYTERHSSIDTSFDTAFRIHLISRSVRQNAITPMDRHCLSTAADVLWPRLSPVEANLQLPLRSSWREHSRDRHHSQKDWTGRCSNLQTSCFLLPSAASHFLALTTRRMTLL